MKKLLMIIAVFCSQGVACTHNSEVTLSESIGSDSEYQEALKKTHREELVVRDLETKNILNVTKLDPSFLEAFRKRAKKVYSTDDFTMLKDIENKTAFFVSVYCDEMDRCNLSNKNLWTIQLKSPSSDVTPAIVRQMSNKGQWEQFFPGITSWSNDFLVIFDAKNAGQAEQLTDSNIELLFANAYANIRFKW